TSTAPPSWPSLSRRGRSSPITTPRTRSRCKPSPVTLRSASRAAITRCRRAASSTCRRASSTLCTPTRIRRSCSPCTRAPPTPRSSPLLLRAPPQVERLPVAVVEFDVGKQFGAAGGGAQQRLVAPPPLHARVVSGQQHRRHLQAAPLAGLGVAGAFEQAVGEAVLLVAAPVAQHAGHEPDNGLRHHQHRHLAADEHVVADGDLLNAVAVARVLHDPLVD